MKIKDVVLFCVRSLAGYPLRTGLMLLAMAIGVAAVVLLTSLGEGARRYVTDQFSSLGTHLLIVLPGRSETVGGPPPLLGQTPRDLTLSDAMSLKSSSAIHHVAPLMVGAAPVGHGHLIREVIVLGSTAELYIVRGLTMAQGRFIPTGDVNRAEALCVLGYKLKSELFGSDSPLGQFVRIADRRYRVVGVLSKKGQSLGFDMSDVAIIPVASASALFNRSSLFRIMVQASGREAIPKAKAAILKIIRERHDDEDDVTVITQDALLATFDRIFKSLTLAVAGIASISLAVAGILIMNVMLIAVSQRTAEVGLLKAVGTPGRQIQRLFLSEAAMLSLIGAGAGLLLAMGGKMVLIRIFPAFPVTIPYWAPAAAVGLALVSGLIFGVLPARRAARLDPVAALSRR
ncbi:MAG: ABC transporter permease [Desulfobacteraceae bacterium]|nr:ABC transporter permease [Desulfobacteraceae bacterium]